MIVDEISPDTLAQKLIGLSIDTQKRVLPGTVVIVTVDYSDADDMGGVVLPLFYTVTQPDGTKLIRRTFNLTGPNELSFQPEVSGIHLVRLGEVFHNRTWGSLQVPVIGDTLQV